MYPVLIRFRSGNVRILWCEDYSDACLASGYLATSPHVVYAMYTGYAARVTHVDK